MCYANPAKSLTLTREGMTPEAWAKFETDFEHFCAYSGLTVEVVGFSFDSPLHDWAKWAYLCGKGL